MTNFQITSYDDYRNARATIAALTTCNPTIDARCDNTLAPFCIHFDNMTLLRNLLIDIDDAPTHNDFADDDDMIHALLRRSLATMIAYPYAQHELSMMRLDHSLCPMHHHDYAICFDDDDPDCEPIRLLFPNHDT